MDAPEFSPPSLTSIQPVSGVLGILERTREIVAADEQASQWLGVAGGKVLGELLDVFLPTPEVAALSELYINAPEGSYLKVQVRSAGKVFWCIFQGKRNGVITLEFEPYQSRRWTLSGINHKIELLAQASTTQMLYEVALTQFCEVGQYQRAFIYKLLPEGGGQVIAEKLTGGLPSMLGWIFPEDDFPVRTRKDFQGISFQQVYQMHAEGIDIEYSSAAHEGTLVLEEVAARQVMPFHRFYLQQLGVTGASFLSISKEGKLWGLMVGHTTSPAYLPAPARNLMELLGRHLSISLYKYGYLDLNQFTIVIGRIQNSLLAALGKEVNLFKAWKLTGNLLESAFNCDGFIMHLAGFSKMSGARVPESEIEDFIQFLGQQDYPEGVFSTNCLSDKYEPAKSWLPAVAGVMVMRLSDNKPSYAIWLRRERKVVEQRLEKGPEAETDDVSSIHRSSFVPQQESVGQQSVAWLPAELEAAQEMFQSLVKGIVQTAEVYQEQNRTLHQLNTRLRQTNEELDSFAYVASHDLREPLRGLHHYSSFLLEDYEDQLDEAGKKKLHALIRLSKKMENLIEGLLMFAQVGRANMDFVEVDLAHAVDEVIELYRPRLDVESIKLFKEGEFPFVPCNAVRIKEAVNNLIGNAIKYNDKHDKNIWVEGKVCKSIDLPEEGLPKGSYMVISVRDNGMGINPKHLKKVFKIFSKLSSSKAKPGSGIGLAIVKKIMDRHNGIVWVESEQEKGSVFSLAWPIEIRTDN
ncbi:MAG: ATP-binding protein [Bacteroidota bacterium]